jgi:hypothetical protein
MLLDLGRDIQVKSVKISPLKTTASLEVYVEKTARPGLRSVEVDHKRQLARVRVEREPYQEVETGKKELARVAAKKELELVQKRERLSKQAPKTQVTEAQKPVPFTTYANLRVQVPTNAGDYQYWDGKTCDVTLRNAGNGWVFDKEYTVGIRNAGASAAGWLATADGVKLGPGDEKTIPVTWWKTSSTMVELAKKPKPIATLKQAQELESQAPAILGQQDTSPKLFEAVVDIYDKINEGDSEAEKDNISNKFRLMVEPKIIPPAPIPMGPDIQILEPNKNAKWIKGKDHTVIWICNDPAVCRLKMPIELYDSNNSLKSTQFWGGTPSLYQSGFIAKQKFQVPTEILDGSYYIKIHDTQPYVGQEPPEYQSEPFMISTALPPSAYYPVGNFEITKVNMPWTPPSLSPGSALGLTVKVQPNCQKDFQLGAYGSIEYGCQYISVKIENMDWQTGGKTVLTQIYSISGKDNSKPFTIYPAGVLKGSQGYDLDFVVKPLPAMHIIKNKIDKKNVFDKSYFCTRWYYPKVTITLTTFTMAGNGYFVSQTTAPYVMYLENINLPIKTIQTYVKGAWMCSDGEHVKW